MDKDIFEMYLNSLGEKEFIKEIKEYFQEYPDDFDNSFFSNTMNGTMTFTCRDRGRTLSFYFNKFTNVSVLASDDYWAVSATGTPGRRVPNSIFIELEIFNGVPAKFSAQHGGSRYSTSLPSSDVKVVLSNNKMSVRFDNLPADLSKSCKGRGFLIVRA